MAASGHLAAAMYGSRSEATAVRGAACGSCCMLLVGRASGQEGFPEGDQMRRSGLFLQLSSLS